MLDWSGVKFWSEKVSSLPFIQTKPGRILENTKNINFHSAGVDVNSYQT